VLVATNEGSEGDSPAHQLADSAFWMDGRQRLPWDTLGLTVSLSDPKTRFLSRQSPVAFAHFWFASLFLFESAPKNRLASERAYKPQKSSGVVVDDDSHPAGLGRFFYWRT
jgi:hypothetical protein